MTTHYIIADTDDQRRAIAVTAANEADARAQAAAMGVNVLRIEVALTDEEWAVDADAEAADDAVRAEIAAEKKARDEMEQWLWDCHNAPFEAAMLAEAEHEAAQDRALAKIKRNEV